MLATVLPSILRLRAMFHPKFAVRKTIKRPPGWAAVPIETAQTKTRIRRSLMAEVNLEFMAPMLPSGLIFGQPGVHRHSGLSWWPELLPENLTSASRRKELKTF